jgi:hypothetical protein
MSFPVRSRRLTQLRKGDGLATPDGRSRGQVEKVIVRHLDETHTTYDLYLRDAEAPYPYIQDIEVFITAGAKCGNCSTKEWPVQHPTTEDVKSCFAVRYEQAEYEDWMIAGEQEAERLATRYWEEHF